MVVFRGLLAPLAGLGLLLAGVVAAHAQDCGPGAVLAAYRQAEDAAARQDGAAAGAGFRALAEQGLGPAQLRLGQILAAGSGKTDATEAYRWLALAADIGAPGAKEALSAQVARLGPAQVAQLDFAPKGWQPKLGPCLAGDPHARADGKPGYDFARVVNRLMAAPSATGPAERRRAWLADMLDAVRAKRPRALIYFKALYGIGWVGGAAPFVVAAEREGQPMLAINESYTEAPAPERLDMLVEAAVHAVHAGLAPPTAAAAALVETYKGYTIRSLSSADGKAFIAFAKQAIDMSEQLPPDLLKLARANTDLRYEPHVAFDRRGGALVLGAYTRDKQTGHGYMSYAENFEQRGVARMVMTLVGAGIYHRRELATGKAGPPPDPAHGDCEIDDIDIKTMEALKLDAIEINRAYKLRAYHNCS